MSDAKKAATVVESHTDAAPKLSPAVHVHLSRDLDKPAEQVAKQVAGVVKTAVAQILNGKR